MQYIKLFKFRIRIMMRLLILVFIHNLWIVNSIPYLRTQINSKNINKQSEIGEIDKTGINQEYNVKNIYELNFTSIGDWGCYQLGEPYRKYQYLVGYAMGERCCENDCEFVINVGDNFYPNISNNINQKIWNSNFENMYRDHSLMIPWYSILGNHDYIAYPEKQLLYVSQNYNRWQMPSRYYNTTTFREDFPMKLNFIFLDTSPCIKKYRNMMLEVNISSEESVKNSFINNILSQNCSEQYEWFRDTLKWYVKMDEKVIVVGHHPIYQIDYDDDGVNFIDLFQKHDSHILLYLSGHKHRLERYHIKHSKTEFIISGSGCQYENNNDKNNVIKYLFQSENDDDYILEDKMHETVYKNATLGFTNHNVKYDKYTNKFNIINTFYDINNEKIYTFSI